MYLSISKNLHFFALFIVCCRKNYPQAVEKSVDIHLMTVSLLGYYC